MISFVAHKLLSVVGEVDPVKETGSGSETALEIIEETESEIEGGTEKERESDFVTGTETEGKEVDIEDNEFLETLIEDKKSCIFFLCVLQVVSLFSAVYLKFIV